MTSADARLALLSERFARDARQERTHLLADLMAGRATMLRQRAHRLAGTAAMFGFPKLGAAALALDDALERHLNPGGTTLALAEMLEDIARSTTP